MGLYDARGLGHRHAGAPQVRTNLEVGFVNQSKCYQSLVWLFYRYPNSGWLDSGFGKNPNGGGSVDAFQVLLACTLKLGGKLLDHR